MLFCIHRQKPPSNAGPDLITLFWTVLFCRSRQSHQPLSVAVTLRPLLTETIDISHAVLLLKILQWFSFSPRVKNKFLWWPKAIFCPDSPIDSQTCCPKNHLHPPTSSYLVLWRAALLRQLKDFADYFLCPNFCSPEVLLLQIKLIINRIPGNLFFSFCINFVLPNRIKLSPSFLFSPPKSWIVSITHNLKSFLNMGVHILKLFSSPCAERITHRN